MPALDASILKLIEEISDHYMNNLSTRHLRKALSSIQLEPGTWDLIENFVQPSEYARHQEYQFDELYERILALAKFVYKARTEVSPRLKTMAGSVGAVSSKSDSMNDQLIRNMAISNFDSNLGVMSDLVNELYMKTVELDRLNHASKRPVYERMPELKEIGRLLIQS